MSDSSKGNPEIRRNFIPKGNPDIQIYPFHKTPDGEDCLEKTYYYTKYCAIGGAVFSFYEMVFRSKPSTAYGVMARFGRFTLPFAAMGFTFGTSLCLLGKLRGKTDIPNHAISGALAGAVWGVKYNSVSVGHTWAVVLGCLATYYMYFRVNDLPMFSVRNPDQRTNIPNMDFTIKIYDDPGRPNDM